MQVRAPHLLVFEVTNLVYQRSRRGLITPRGVADIFSVLGMLEIRLERLPEDPQVVFDLARRTGLTAAYDAVYLAMAQRLRCNFWTADRRLYEAASGWFPWVRWIEEVH